MSNKIFAQQGKVAIVAGLNWQTLLKTGKGRATEIRSLASESDASKIVVVENAARAAVGMYSPAEDDYDDGEDGAKLVKPKVMHSLAAVFAAKIGDGNAVLALSMPVVGSLSQAMVIVVEGGVPLLDQIKSTEEAQSLSLSYAGGAMGLTYAFYTNDFNSFSNGELITEAELWEACSKTTVLGPRPANVTALVATLVAMGVLVGGGYGFLEFRKSQERAERARQAALANPTPKYEAALATQINALGMNRDAALAVLARMRQQPLWVEGWLLSKVECGVDSGTCVSSWERAGGTSDDLIASRREVGEEISGDSTNTVVRMAYKVPMPLAGAGTRMGLPTLEESIIGSTSIQQIWENARVITTVGAEGYKVWPQVPGVELNGVRPDVVIKSRPIEIKAGSVLIAEVIATAPANYFWSSIVFDVKVSGRALDSLTANLKGKTYVR